MIVFLFNTFNSFKKYISFKN